MSETLELLQLLLGQRGTHGRDDGLEAGLAERDHIGVSLDDDGALLFGNRGSRQVQAVEDRGLVEELPLRRVDVLPAQRVVVTQLPRLEADDSTARIGEREQQPLREVVVPARVREAGAAELLTREAFLLFWARPVLG